MKHPNLVWEGRRADGRLVSCLVVPAWPKHAVVWYVDETIADAQEFADLEAAKRHAEELRAALVSGTPEPSGRQRLNGP